MRKILLAALLALSAKAAMAQSEHFILQSSCTYSGATVSTGTWAREIDNLNKGAVYAMPGRNKVTINVPSGASSVFVGFDNLISTAPASANYVRTLSTGPNEFYVPATIALWSLAADAAGAAGQRINVEQCKP